MGETHGSTISFSFGIARIRVPALFDDTFLFYHNFHFPGNGFGERFVVYPPKTNMTMENPPFEDVLNFLLKMGISNVMLVSRGVPSLKLSFSPMQIDGSKINFPFGMVCFQGRTVFGGEVNSRGNSGLFSWEL